MKKYRVVTADGFILHETNDLFDAHSWQKQQATRLQETINVERYSRDLEEYLTIEVKETSVHYNRAYVDRLFRDGMNDY